MSSLVFIVFLVPFRAGGTSKIGQKRCTIVRNQGLQKMRQNISKVRFGVDFDVVLGTICDRNVFFEAKRMLRKQTDEKCPPK